MRAYLYLTELLRAEIYHRAPAEKPEDIPWETVFKLAQEHMVVSIAFAGIAKLQNKPEGKVYDTWKELADKALVKEISFDAERAQILQLFEQNGMKYVPLKGIILKDFYGRPGLRQFSDNDILIEADKTDRACELMHGLGYEQEGAVEHHIEFQKQPIYNFELHVQLLPKRIENHAYFQNIWDRVVKDENNAMGYHMTKEDFYIYHILHLEKHFGGSGTGLRYFVDQYYLEKDMLGQLDKQAVDGELEKLQVKAFENKIHKLTEVLFGNPDANWEKLFAEQAEYEQMFLYVMTSGAYGNFDNLIENRMQKAGSKWKYFVSRLTCDDIYYKRDYPILNKAPWLKPVFVVWRIVRAPFKKTEKFKAEVKAMLKKKQK